MNEGKILHFSYECSLDKTRKNDWHGCSVVMGTTIIEEKPLSWQLTAYGNECALETVSVRVANVARDRCTRSNVL